MSWGAAGHVQERQRLAVTSHVDQDDRRSRDAGRGRRSMPASRSACPAGELAVRSFSRTQGRPAGRRLSGRHKEPTFWSPRLDHPGLASAALARPRPGPEGHDQAAAARAGAAAGHGADGGSEPSATLPDRRRTARWSNPGEAAVWWHALRSGLTPTRTIRCSGRSRRLVGSQYSRCCHQEGGPHLEYQECCLAEDRQRQGR